MEWDGTPYHSLNWEIRKQFGKKLYKISLDGGMTCPNRDGTVGYGGCIFCSEGGSGDFAADRELSVREQLKTAKERIRDKLPKGKPGGYIAYFRHLRTHTLQPQGWRLFLRRRWRMKKWKSFPLHQAGLSSGRRAGAAGKTESEKAGMDRAGTADRQ